MSRGFNYDWVWRVAWSNPYTEPPDGRPRELGHEVVLHWRDRSAEDKEPSDWLSGLVAANPGYALTGGGIAPSKIRPRTQEQESTRRVKVMSRRTRKRWPLFADAYIEQEIVRRPSFYAAEDWPQEYERRRQLRQAITDRYQALHAEGR